LFRRPADSDPCGSSGPSARSALTKQKLPEGFEPFETRVRLEFHDEADGRTRLEVRQWLPEHLASPNEEGWLEAFTKLDATLAA
jgi:hypothetical protein